MKKDIKMTKSNDELNKEKGKKKKYIYIMSENNENASIKMTLANH